ncbi:MAG: HAD family hydrolase [Caldilinea sp. CFX5]|nr:HAD family hydrolase [Caldilinea sp. CFX5]
MASSFISRNGETQAPVANQETPPHTGLTAAEVLQRRQKYGQNLLPTAKSPAAWLIFLAQFKSPLVYIILIAAAISLAVGEVGDFAIIMAVVVIDAILGFVEEYQAQRTFTALRGLLKPTTTVLRDGARQEIDVRDLVPGDLVLLSAGERIPGDGELLEGAKITVDEAILTGESEPVKKSSATNENALFAGTTLVTGRGLLRVTQTGTQTELGKIAVSLQEEPEETPLQVRLRAFSRTLTRLVVIVAAAILLTGLLTGRPFLEMLRFSIVLAIAAVPEGLLIAVTVILVLGMRKILKRNGLVKKLLAVETLGSVTVICTDKTGTLTEGRMRVTKSDLVDRVRAFEAMVLCNDLEGPVDVALWEYAQAQLSDESVQALSESAERLAVELFSSETKYMITSNRVNGQRFDYLKGAPEIVLTMCQLTPAEQSKILTQVEQWAGEGLRLLGLAYRPMGKLDERGGYRWIGLVAMADPIREGVREAVQVAQQAGIQVKMITGDYRRTAERIAHNIGLFKGDDQILEGQELTTLTDHQLQERVDKVAVFSRIRPQDKLRIIHALEAKGAITAMIGDGVNDAPALQHAHIGVVVGSATDVAKETADLILLDNNFRTVVAAVEEGRVIFENIRKVVAYTLSNSFAEVLAIFGAMLLGWPAPLLVAQILWIHLICDGPADIMLGFEPKEPGIMVEPPKSLKEPILTRLGLALIATISFSSAVAALLLFGRYFVTAGDPVAGRSFAFASFAVNSMIYIFAYRSLRRPLWRTGSPLQNKPLVFSVLGGLLLAVGVFFVPALRTLLDIIPLTIGQWSVVFGIAVAQLIVVEIGKWISKTRGEQRL